MTTANIFLIKINFLFSLSQALQDDVLSLLGNQWYQGLQEVSCASSWLYS